MWLWLLLLVFGLFTFVVFFGAPYLPTFSKQTKIALELLDLKPGQTLLELGCGDGRVLAAAAEKELKVVGYELNPFLALFSWIRTRKYGKQVKVVWGNYWRHSWPPTDGVFVFLLDKYMDKLDKKIIQNYSGKSVNPAVDFRDDRRGRSQSLGRLAERHSEAHYGVKLVSFAFQIPDKKAQKNKDGLFLYQY